MKNLFIKCVFFVSVLLISSAAHLRAADEDIVIIPDNPRPDPPYTEPIPEPASIFLLGAGECYQKWIIATFGILFLISGLLILILGPEKIRQIFEWHQKQPVLIFRVIAVIVLACGAVIVYSA